MTTQPAGRAAADRAASDAAALAPTTIPATDPVPGTAVPGTAGPVTAREITELLRHLAELRGGARGHAPHDPAERAAFLARKAALFARITDPHTCPATGPATAPEGRTP